MKNAPLNPVEIVKRQALLYQTSLGFIGDFGVFQSRVNNTTALLPNLGRLSLALIFAGSVVLQPIQRSISLLLERVVESGKPIFTLLFGGTAAVAKAIQEIVKSL